MDFEQIVVKNNEDEQRYEVKIDDQVAVLTYKRRGDQITYLHTGVPPALAGHSIANRLAHTALEDARAQELTVFPVCPFVATYIRHHLEYLSLLTAAEQARLLDQGQNGSNKSS
ncbi:MAG TPA: GNAT family N-acetyltransferase [Ktedonosporobacter sp.]|nr:GNAT family N-acetyltransferase [Ktedonosporobacter sp.]